MITTTTLLLFITSTAVAAGAPRPATERWREVLQWEDQRFLADNLLFLRPLGEGGPGIGEVGTVARFSWEPEGVGTPGRIVFLRGRGRLQPRLIERRVTPFALWERYRVGEATWTQRLCLSDDVFVLEGTLAPTVDIDIVVEGHLRGAQGALGSNGLLNGVFTGGDADGLAFSFWSSLGAPTLHGQRGDLTYRAFSRHETACSLLFGVGPTRTHAETRLRRLQVAWESAAAEREAEWARFFDEVMPQFLLPEPSWSDLICWIGYCLKVNAFQLPGDSFPRTTGVWKGRCTAIPLENRSLHAIGERWLASPSLAVGDLRPWNTVRPDGAGLVWVLAADAVNRLWPLAELLPEACTQARKVVEDFLAMHDRDGDALPEIRSNVTGLGWDNSARFDPAVQGRYEQGRQFERDLIPLDTSVLFMLAARSAGRFATDAGDAMSGRYFRGLAEQAGAEIEARAWDEAAGYYSDLAGPDWRPSGVLTPASLFPLWAHLGRGRAERLLAQTLTPARLWPTYPLPTCSLSDTGYGGYWRGKVALRINWVILEALRTAGHSEHGRALLDNMVRRYAEHRYDCAEMYSAVNGGAPQWLYSPEMALLLDQLARAVAGVEPLGHGVWSFNPCFLDEGWPYLRFGPVAYGTDTLEVRWDRPGDGQDWFADGVEGHWIAVNGRGRAALPGTVVRR